MAFDGYCRGNIVGTFKGRLEHDPVFRSCLGCLAYLRRMGIPVREVKS